MPKISEQLSSAIPERNKLFTKFVKAYKRNLQWNILQTWESWNCIKTLDEGFELCEPLFRSCWQDSPSEAGLSSVNETEIFNVLSFENKDLEFFDDKELLELNRLIHLFLDLSVPYFLSPQVQNLIDFLIYKYELTVRYPDKTIINFLQYHGTDYFLKLLSLSTLPKSSDVSYFILNKDKKITLHNHEGISKHVVVDGITKFFSNYKKLSQSINSIVLKLKKYEKNKSYIAFYNILTLSVIESKGKAFSEDEIRFFLNNIIDGLKNVEYLEYYNAQLCALAVLSTKVSLNIPTQKALITAILEPLLCGINENDQIPFYLRVAVKNAMALIAVLLGHQKERITVLPENVLELFFRKCASSDVILRTLSSPTAFGGVIDFSRLCNIIFRSLLKIMKTGVDSALISDERCNPESESFKYSACLANIVRNSNTGVHYSKIFFFSVMDELSRLFSASYGNGNLLVSYSKSNSDRIIEVYNKKYAAALVVLRIILNVLNKTHKTEMEVLIDRYVGKSSCFNYVDVLLFVSNSLFEQSGPKGLNILNVLPSNQNSLLPPIVTKKNIHKILLLYADTMLPHETRLKIYKLVVESMTGGFFIQTGEDDDEYYSLITYFFSVTLRYDDLFDLQCSKREIWDFIPVKRSLIILMTYVQQILNDIDKEMSFNTVFVVDMVRKNEYNVDTTQLFDTYALGFSCNDSSLRKLSTMLHLSLDLIEKSPENTSFIHDSILHFIVLLKRVSYGKNEMSSIFEICERYLRLVKVVEFDLQLLLKSSFYMLKTLQDLVGKKEISENINDGASESSLNENIIGYSNSCFLINGLVVSYIICSLSNFVCESHVGVMHAISIASMHQLNKLVGLGYFSDSLSNMFLESSKASLIVLSLYIKVFDARNFSNVMLFYHLILLLNEENFLNSLKKILEDFKVGIYSPVLTKYCFECCSFFISMYNSKRNIISSVENSDHWIASTYVDFILENENIVVNTDKRIVDVSDDGMTIAEDIFTTLCSANFHSRNSTVPFVDFSHFSDKNGLRLKLLSSVSDVNLSYARGCNFLGYIFRSVSESEPQRLPEVFIDFVVNFLPFILHRDYEIRSEAGKLLKDISTLYSRNRALYDKNFINEHCSRVFLKVDLFGNFEFPGKVELSLRNFSKYLVQLNDSFYELSSSFPKVLSIHGENNVDFLFLLLLRCVTVSTHLMFDMSVVKCLLSALSNTKSTSTFGLDKILSRILKHIGDQIPILTKKQEVPLHICSIKHLISLLSVAIVMISTGKVFDDEKMMFFGRTICPDILKITKTLNSLTESALEDSCISRHHKQLNNILLMLKDCSLLSLHTLRNGIFWKLSNNERIKLLKSFIDVFYGFDIANSILVMDWIFETKNQKLFPQFLAFLYSLEEVPHKLTEMILLSVMKKIDSLQVLEKIFSTTMEAGYDAFNTVSIASKILLKLVLGTSFTQTKVQTFVFAATTKLLKFGMEKVKTGGEILDPIHTEICDYLNLLYSRMNKLTQENPTLECTLVDSLHHSVCVFVKSLALLFGPLVFVAVKGFLKNMIATFIKSTCELTLDCGLAAVIDAISICCKDENIYLSINSLFEIPYTIFDDNDASLKPAHTFWMSYSIFVCLTSRNIQSESIHTKILGLMHQNSDILSIISSLSKFSIISIMSFSEVKPMFDLPTVNINSFTVKNIRKDAMFQDVLNIFTFIRMAVESFDVFVLNCSQDSFNDRTSPSFCSYARLSELVHFSTFALSILESVPFDLTYTKKRRQEAKSVKVNMPSNQDICEQVYRKIEQFVTNIFRLNYAFSSTTIVCRAIRLFCNLKGNFDQNMVDNMWIKDAIGDIHNFRIITGYFTYILHFLNRVKKHRKSMLESKKLSKEFETINSEISTILLCLVKYGLLGRDEDRNIYISRCKGEIWKYFVNYPPTSLLSIQNLMEVISLVIEQSLSDIRNVDKCKFICSDLIYVIKNVVLLSEQEFFGCMKIDRISALLVDVSSVLLSNGKMDYSVCKLLFLVLLAFQRSFGNIFGNEFHKHMILLVFNYKNIVHSGTPLSFCLDKKQVNNSSMWEICDIIFSDILKYDTEKLLETMNQNTNDAINRCGADYNIILVMAYYSSAYIKPSSLIKIFLNLDQSDQNDTLERYGKLMMMLTINLHFNKIKEKYAKVFEKKHAIILNYYVSLFSEFIKDTTKSTFSDAVYNLGKYFIFKGQNYLTKHETMFSSSIFTMLTEKENAVVVFHDLLISFSLEYASRVTTKDLFKIIETHTKLLNINTLNADYDVIDSGDMHKVLGEYANSNLFLRILVITVKKYGKFGTTQYITPRIYQNVNDVLYSALKIAKLIKSSGAQLNLDNSWIWLNNSTLALSFMQESVKTWNSERSSVPDLCISSWICLIEKCLSLFEILPIYPENNALSQHITVVWSDALKKTLKELIESCKNDEKVVKIEACLSHNLARRDNCTKIAILNILNDLWEHSSIHLSATLKNVMPEIGELVDDEMEVVRSYAQCLNEKINSLVSFTD